MDWMWIFNKKFTLGTISRVATEYMGGVGTWEQENHANVFQGELKLYSYYRFTLTELKAPQSRILSTLSPFLISVIKDIESEDVKKKNFIFRKCFGPMKDPNSVPGSENVLAPDSDEET